MDELPLLPKTKSAWVACFLLITVLFLYYYNYLYPELLDSYKEQNYVIPYTLKQNDPLTKDLEIHLVVPKFLGADAVQFVNVSVYNHSNKAQNLKLRLIWEKKSEDVDGVNGDLSVIALVDTLQLETESVQVQSHSFEFVRLPLIFVGESVILKEELFVLVKLLTPEGSLVGEEKLSAEFDGVIPIVNRINSSMYFVLKDLLLPPLANGLLPALAIMSCWFVEGESKDQKIKLIEVMNVFIESAAWALSLITIFYFVEVGKYASIPILLISLVIICIYTISNHKLLLKTIKAVMALRVKA